MGQDFRAGSLVMRGKELGLGASTGSNCKSEGNRRPRSIGKMCLDQRRQMSHEELVIKVKFGLA